MATYARRAYGFGRADEASHPDSIRATLAEFLSTFVFVFAGEGSILALGLVLLVSVIKRKYSERKQKKNILSQIFLLEKLVYYLF